jgi:hypothetical protein
MQNHHHHHQQQQQQQQQRKYNNNHNQNNQNNHSNNRVYQPREKIDYNDVIVGLQDYMLSNKLLVRSQKTMQPSQPNKKDDAFRKKQQPLPIKDSFFRPKEKDTLFWCYFVIKNGESKYGHPDDSGFVNEKRLKFKCIDDLRLHKQELKNYKIKNIKEVCEDDLANRERIGIKTFIALCVVANINIMYIEKRKCHEVICEEDAPIHVIHCVDDATRKYAYEMETTPAKLQEYRNKYFIWENLDKPLKAMSSYKSEELQELCNQLAIDTTTTSVKKTKKFLYELLVQHLT